MLVKPDESEPVEFSAGGIVCVGHNILLVHQRRTDTWAFPKGHIEQGESDFDAAVREIKEETGLTSLTYRGHLGFYTRGTKKSGAITKHITMYLFTSDTNCVAPRSEDVTHCKWVPFEKVIQNLSYEEDGEFFRGASIQIERILKCRK